MRRFKVFVCSLVMVCMMFAQMVCVASATEAEQTAKITITLDDNGKQLSDVGFKLFKVADVTVTPQGLVIDLSLEFADSNVSLEPETAQETIELMNTLNTYIAEHDVKPVSAVVTDENGVAVASDLALGMYLVVAENDDNYGTIATSFVIVPVVEDGSWQYDIDLTPKYSDDDIEQTTPPGTRPPSDDEPILGIEDMSGYIGTMLLAVGFMLFMMALILLVRRGTATNE